MVPPNDCQGRREKHRSKEFRARNGPECPSGDGQYGQGSREAPTSAAQESYGRCARKRAKPRERAISARKIQKVKNCARKRRIDPLLPVRRLRKKFCARDLMMFD